MTLYRTLSTSQTIHPTPQQLTLIAGLPGRGSVTATEYATLPPRFSPAQPRGPLVLRTLFLPLSQQYSTSLALPTSLVPRSVVQILSLSHTLLLLSLKSACVPRGSHDRTVVSRSVLALPHLPPRPSSRWSGERLSHAAAVAARFFFLPMRHESASGGDGARPWGYPEGRLRDAVSRRSHFLLGGAIFLRGRRRGSACMGFCKGMGLGG